jgi:hypothetical protein
LSSYSSLYIFPCRAPHNNMALWLRLKTYNYGSSNFLLSLRASRCATCHSLRGLPSPSLSRSLYAGHTTAPSGRDPCAHYILPPPCIILHPYYHSHPHFHPHYMSLCECTILAPHYSIIELLRVSEICDTWYLNYVAGGPACGRHY